MRIRDTGGAVLGAGVVLGTRQVLTCAHVVSQAAPPADVDVVVELVFRPDVGPVPARVDPGAWVPPLPDERGDLALLDLAGPVPEGCGAVLCEELPLWNRPVHAFGHPARLDDGVWVRTRLAGPGGPAAEWWQMDRVTPADRISRGFSGAGVVDDATGYVVGVVVGEYTDGPTGLSWMIPVNRVVHYLPPVGRWVTGSPAVDAPFIRRYRPRAQDRRTARQIRDFFAAHEPDRVLVVVTGADDSSASAALYRAVVLSSGALRPRAGAVAEGGPDPAGPVPPVGSIGLAIDASGRTVDEVWRRLLDWLGLPLDGSKPLSDGLGADRPPLGVVVDRVDEAADPDALVRKVLVPLAEANVRLLAAFRREPPPSVDALLAAGSSAHHPDPPEDPATVASRISDLEDRIGRVRVAERAVRHRHREVAPRIAGVPGPPRDGPRLRLRLDGIRDAATEGRRVLPSIDACAREAQQAVDEAGRILAELDRALARRDELRGRLEAYRAMAADRGRTEDRELARRYREAREVLWRGPCDLVAAADAVHGYVQAVLA